MIQTPLVKKKQVRKIRVTMLDTKIVCLPCFCCTFSHNFHLHLGRWVAALRPPQPKKMPRPVSGTEVATPKWSGPTAPSTKRAREPTSPSRVDSRAKKLVVRPSSKAVPRAPSKPSIRPPAPPVPTLPEKPAYETSTGLRPQPPPMSMYDENELGHLKMSKMWMCF